MKKYRELSYKELKRYIDPSELDFKTTEDLEPLEGIIGQERAVKAMEFGLNIKMRGYNIYMSGPTGSGKTSYAQSCIKDFAKNEPVPYDWCYVYNYSKPSNPIALRFPPGLGKEFRDDMNELIEYLLADIPKAFSSEEYEKEKSEIIKDYQNKRDDLLNQLKEKAQKLGFAVKMTGAGIYFVPIVNGEVIEEEDYRNLGKEVQEQIDQLTDEIQSEVTETMKTIRNLERKARQKIEDLDYKIGLFAVGHHINYLKEKYKEYDRVIKYLEAVQEDVLENIQEFLEYEEDEEEAQPPVPAALMPFMVKSIEDVVKKYRVNLFVDNTEIKGAPVIVDFNPTYNKLIGQIEYDNEFGNLTTDFMKIKPGLFHQANGGYLILQAKDVLNNSYSWEAIKRVLKTKEVTIENLRELMGLTAVSSLKPEPIPVSVKVILIGSTYLYDLLYAYDEDFRKLFKIRVDFDSEMDNNHENIKMLARFVHGFTKRENTAPFTADAIAKIAEYASRLAENQEKMTTRFNSIVEILCEASIWSKMSNKKEITAEDIEKAITEKEKRSNLYEEKMEELIKDNVIMIDCEGEKVGQINGLAILDTGDYRFAKPSRITATTYMGQSGIINIEKESEMSGNIHDKGVQVLTGYLGQTYAQEFPLSLSCRICFEQSYSGVDGDSASSTELYAILSSLSGVPIKQGIAVTGSINQNGEIQPIGGVSHKIEGFYKICKLKGLTGEQGVIIPYQNVKDLVLKDEVIEAVKEGKFHIYPISHVDEGIEILTGVPAGQKDENNRYDENTIHGKVYAKLKAFYEKTLEQNHSKENN
ncbi:MAG TPA: ATP-binding protein [Defluviitaleaceae bacterium]|nr:ATP-binding protein [Defluviitaleaceae bacterium]HPT75490.1 ATP-binding protein [Defluviitaleaceae bacterium]HQD49891.1 ATP-binding protein [Defluviitaleaceae bacterium]